MTKIYTGVGWRDAPNEAIDMAWNVSSVLAYKGYTLRSGCADGMDYAFETGAHRIEDARTEIYLPSKTFNLSSQMDKSNYITPEMIDQDKWLEAQDIARKVHPSNFKNCTIFAKCAHTRNVFQLLGKDLDKPSDFMIYYANEKDGEPIGGTRTAVKLAEQFGIPCYNLRDQSVVDRLNKMMRDEFYKNQKE